MANKVVILGSLNMDYILHISRLPLPGETMSMNDKSSASGGKGANQAVAAARAGQADTSFIGRIGQDPTGQVLTENLRNDHVDTSKIKIDPTCESGQAFILLQESGQNSILVYGGANQRVSKQDIDAAKDLIKNADFLVAQFEVPVETVDYAFKYAKSVGVKTILNPAPAKQGLPKDLLKLSDLVCPNETEAEQITGIKVTDEASLKANAQKFAEMGCQRLIVTLGEHGSYYSDGIKNNSGLVKAFKVKPKDTTGAGDTFIGSLAADLKPDFSNLMAAINFASRASSLAVQKLGAQPSIPTLKEIKNSLN